MEMITIMPATAPTETQTNRTEKREIHLVILHRENEVNLIYVI